MVCSCQLCRTITQLIMDFVFGRVSIDLIEPNLYLGGLSAAKDVTTLTDYKITHILTINSYPLPDKILELGHITTKYIQLDDQPNEDILSYFDETNAFILDGLSKGAVLVHCFFGVSRSATIVIAYIMKKYQITFKDAFEIVKAKRSAIHPNLGFVSQLILYEDMGYKVDKNNIEFKNLRLNIAACKMRIKKSLPENFRDLIKYDPGLSDVHSNSSVYQCKKCNRILALHSHVIIHKCGNEDCKQTYFCEPLAWMMITEMIQGELHCPQCESKVGGFNWLAGYRCSCNVKVAPAFYLMPSEINFVNK